ncbi:MAG: methionyl-tRNA formyltransferase [Erysipelotrichaceae bacterium]|nr:methionyl-tRNA formyltransferase [Erysipelotrichaceae bacterium]
MEFEDKKIVFMGTPQFAAHILEGLFKANYTIVAAVTQPDKEVGRKKILTPSKVKEKALELSIPVLTPVKIKDEYEQVLSYEPDLIITAAYGQFIPSVILDYPKYKCINAHGSLLPKYRGGAPIQRAIINGEKETGITIQYMAKKMDQGEILYQRSIPIDIEDTNSTMFEKLSDLALDMLLQFLPKLFSGDVHPVMQDENEATYAWNLEKEIEEIGFSRPVRNVYDHIRGLLDAPGAYFLCKGKKYKMEKVFFEEYADTDPCVFQGLEKDYLRIDCEDGFIKVYQIKPEGKNSMDAKAFYNGAGRSLKGEKLG